MEDWKAGRLEGRIAGKGSGSKWNRKAGLRRMQTWCGNRPWKLSGVYYNNSRYAFNRFTYADIDQKC